MKSRIKYGIKVTLNLSVNVLGNSNDETDFSRRFMSTYTQVSRLRKTFANCLLANIKLPKTQLYKILQLGKFSARLSDSLMIQGLLLMKNAPTQLDKTVLINDSSIIKHFWIYRECTDNFK